MDTATSKLSQSFECKYCKKSYRRESTLAAHICEPKRRLQQEKETGVQLGLQAYIRFYELTQGSAKTKTYTTFTESNYYQAFVKFGRHMVKIRAVNPKAFIEYVIRENKKLDHWTKDKIYEDYLYNYVRKENAQDALERALKEMQRYADEHLDGRFADYFRDGSANKICQNISHGRMSPWVIFQCDSGTDFLANLNEEQLGIIMPWIDPEHWQHRFRDYVADVEWTKEILSKAGL
jgi:hypothetical protein